MLQVLGSIAYLFVLLRIASWTRGWFTAVLLVVGAIGVAGNVAYGFDTIHVSLGDVALVDAPGAANLIKPLGLCFPLMLLLAAVPLRRATPRLAALLAIAALAFPVAHIGNIAWLAVVDNMALVVALGTLALVRAPLDRRAFDQGRAATVGAHAAANHG